MAASSRNVAKRSRGTSTRKMLKKMRWQKRQGLGALRHLRWRSAYSGQRVHYQCSHKESQGSFHRTPGICVSRSWANVSGNSVEKRHNVFRWGWLLQIMNVLKMNPPPLPNISMFCFTWAPIFLGVQKAARAAYPRRRPRR